MPKITRVVWILALVSLFMDLASEMLYPVMPIYLKSIGFSVVFIGLLEGFADAIAGLSKGYFGHWSDISGKRMPFVRIGYALSAISKPLLGLFPLPVWVFGARTLDRLGKGIRSAPRDAVLSAESTPENRGAAFGFHRAWDTVGAICGPLVAMIWLYFHPGSYIPLFFIAFVPGMISVVLTLLIKDKVSAPIVAGPSLKNLFNYWRSAGINYRRVSGLLLLFALFNSSDAFLLLRIKDAGYDDSALIWVYVFYNLVFALASYPLGRLADKIGLRSVIAGGMLLFVLVYACVGWVNNFIILAILFLLYGLFAAATEGQSRAWISKLCLPYDSATAIGSFLAGQSLAHLAASSLTATLWYFFGPGIALTVSAIGALLVSFLLMHIERKTR